MNDTGVGFVVEADGLVTFHAGDHGDQVAVKIGLHYTLETLESRCFFPMHKATSACGSCIDHRQHGSTCP